MIRKHILSKNTFNFYKIDQELRPTFFFFFQQMAKKLDILWPQHN